MAVSGFRPRRSRRCEPPIGPALRMSRRRVSDRHGRPTLTAARRAPVAPHHSPGIRQECGGSSESTPHSRPPGPMGAGTPSRSSGRSRRSETGGPPRRGHRRRRAPRPARARFWEHIVPREIRACAPGDLVLHLQNPVPPTQLEDHLALLGRDASLAAGWTASRFIQFRKQLSLIPIPGGLGEGSPERPNPRHDAGTLTDEQRASLAPFCNDHRLNSGVRKFGPACAVDPMKRDVSGHLGQFCTGAPLMKRASVS